MSFKSNISADFQAFIDYSQDAFALTDEEGNIIEWNSAQELISEFKKDEVLGRKIWEIQGYLAINYNQAPEKQNLLFNKMKYIISTGDDSEIKNLIEVQIKTKSSKIKYIQQRGFLIKTEKGYKLGSILRDITEEKFLLDKLTENKRHLTLISDNLPVLINHLDKNFRFLFVNREHSRLIGLSYSQVIGRHLSEIIGIDNFENNAQYFNRVFSGETVRFESNVFDFRKKERIIDFTFIPEMKNFEVNGFFTLGVDITEKKKIEKENKKFLDESIEAKVVLEKLLTEKTLLIDELENVKNKLVESIDVKNKFFSIIAHDLRSPISGLMSLTDIMANEAEIIPPEDLKEMSVALNQASANTYKLLNELLDWARIQTGKMPFSPKINNIKNIIYEEISFALNKINSKNLLIDCLKVEDINCYCDSLMISTTIRNLLSNSIKFSNNNGKIEFSAMYDGDFIKVSIKDNGVGISENNINQLFKIDSQITTLGTANEKGTGLGLILCKEFIDRNGGNIFVNSELGKWTEITFTVPISENY